MGVLSSKLPKFVTVTAIYALSENKASNIHYSFQRLLNGQHGGIIILYYNQLIIACHTPIYMCMADIVNLFC